MCALFIYSIECLWLGQPLATVYSSRIVWSFWRSASPDWAADRTEAFYDIFHITHSAFRRFRTLAGYIKPQYPQKRFKAKRETRRTGLRHECWLFRQPNKPFNMSKILTCVWPLDRHEDILSYELQMGTRILRLSNLEIADDEFFRLNF